MKLKDFIHNLFPNVTSIKNQDLRFVLPYYTTLNKSLNSNFLDTNDDNVNNISQIISWPTNIFIVLHTILEFTDKYRLIVSPQDDFSWKRDDRDKVILLASEWNTLLKYQLTPDKDENNNEIPFSSTLSRYRNLLETVKSVFNPTNFDSCIYQLFDNNHQFIKSFFLLFFSIDEAFSSYNLVNKKEHKEAIYWHVTLRRLNSLKRNIENGNKNPAFNLSDSENKFGVVTIKTNTPQSGLTINNLTHNLTTIKPSVKPIVEHHSNESNPTSNFNILFLPWPLEIEDNFFRPAKTNHDLDDYFGFFDYIPTKDPSCNHLMSIIDSAIKRVGNIDAIVLPECSLSEKTFSSYKKALESRFGKDAPCLISGVYGENNKNSVYITHSATGYDELSTKEQAKHHRWFLDKNQLQSYNLAGTLSPYKKWWENININRRQLISLHFENGIHLCPLICEDLARQEPVAQAVRSIGPNLVVSLLLDGPQLPHRWPGKYAAVLSDDPGSSVLTVTALGMTTRSTGLGHPPSRAVALWSEPGKSAETILLDDDCHGIIINTSIGCQDEWTLDGRKKSKYIIRKHHHYSIKFEKTSRYDIIRRWYRDSVINIQRKRK